MHELAMQIVDIVTLCPEIQLCYMGLGTKCFEILENRTPTGSAVDGGGDESGEADDEDSDDSGSVDADDIDDGEDDSLDADMSDEEEEEEEEEADDDDDDDDDNRSDGSNGSGGWDGSRADDRMSPRLRLQEILFYDKVAIFKARHGRL
jgi:hypothetical protein